MNIALPIELVAGDRGFYNCKITGGAIDAAIFSIKLNLKPGYFYDSENNKIKHVIPQESAEDTIEDAFVIGLGSPYSIAKTTDSDSSDLVINHRILIENGDNPATTNVVYFILPSALTNCFEEGRYTYDITVAEHLASSSQTEERYTSVYSNAFVVRRKINTINQTAAV